MSVNLLNHNKVYNNCNIYLQIKKKKKIENNSISTSYWYMITKAGGDSAYQPFFKKGAWVGEIEHLWSAVQTISKVHT